MASVSVLSGAPSLPPKRRHLSAAAALAKRNACSTGMASANPTAKAPWNTSPAASVSTALILGAATWRTDPAERSNHQLPAAPPVTATRASVRRARASQACSRAKLLAAEDARRRLRCDDVRRQRKQAFQHVERCGVGVKDGRTTDGVRSSQGQGGSTWPAHIDQHGVECGEVGDGQRLGIGLGALVIERHNDALAMCIDEDGGQRRSGADDAPDEAAVNALGFDPGDQLVADGVIARARPQRYLGTEPACRTGCTRCHACGDLDAVRGDELALMRGQRVDAKDRVERQGTNAEEVHGSVHETC